jgi:hypothetical protein
MLLVRVFGKHVGLAYQRLVFRRVFAHRCQNFLDGCHSRRSIAFTLFQILSGFEWRELLGLL